MAYELKLLSDEEFDEYKKEKQKKAFLEDLERISKPLTKKERKSFTIKDVVDTSKKDTPPKKELKLSDLAKNFSINLDESVIKDEWGDFVSEIQEYGLGDDSPIESITSGEITGFALDIDKVDSDSTKYSKVFKKEIAMLSEVLKEVKSQGTVVKNTLKKINVGGKSASSRVSTVPKGYTDLCDVYNGINKTKLDIIKEMAALRSKQMDWEFKDKANNAADNSESTDTIADKYYKRIMDGGTNSYIEKTNASVTPMDFQYDHILEGKDRETFERELGGINTKKINASQPIYGENDGFEDIDMEGDEYGYISNEHNDYEVVAYCYGDNKYQLAAIDSSGEVVEDVELPSDFDPSIINSLSLRPGSNVVYDKYGRSYRVIEMGEVDVSDIDDMEYPY